MNHPVKWAAELAHVREVSLLGTADLQFWKERLRPEELVPAESNGRAEVLIIAADARYMGVRFREVSFSVVVARPGTETGKDAAFLIRAFNSSRFFAFCERVFFSTPYYHAAVRVSASLPAAIEVTQNGEVVFGARMGASDSGPVREAARREESGWEGPIFLPGNRRGPGQKGSLFLARLRGTTETYPFLPDKDSMVIKPSRESELTQLLMDSRFAPEEWLIREDATHAKSKTYKRKHLFPDGAT
jgi:hypothetical protein